MIINTGLTVPEGAYIPFKRSEYKLIETYNPDKFNWLDFLGWFYHTSCTIKNREQVNVLSAYIDAANVYGADCKRATALRRLDGSGKLKSDQTGAGELLPKNPGGMANAKLPDNAPDERFFMAGDVRCNEHAVLTSMHTLFVREHNRLCDEIINRYSDYIHPKKHIQDEAIYQAARKVIGAKMQVITFNEFLPALLGENAIPTYCGYDPYLDASVSNEFSTAFYRLGHSMLSEIITLGGGAGTMALREMFFVPALVENSAIETFLGGLRTHVMQNIDRHVIDSVRNFLFNPPGTPALNAFLDLVSLNIQCGRDHGLPSYNECRAAYGLTRRTEKKHQTTENPPPPPPPPPPPNPPLPPPPPPPPPPPTPPPLRKNSFSEISSNPDTVQALTDAYQDSNCIDPWVGALAEDIIPGAAVGELIRTALIEQFIRLRDGDRF